MRLKCIKLAGFKSFVDPTTVSFPSNMAAVVGPNGCGKSNIIDAVRWVMGESSAKNLRGESMTDVIFNGSNTRKPVTQASIELVFDNSDNRLTGEYAAFTEISIRRRVSRDGQNTYFLNGSKCRRRDITDIFLGTGLGPRSYSIIEQGMISRLIEARPEELRHFIEEAAGISKYKERRRETENRIRRTQENLARLTDLRAELERNLERLQRQAQAAEKYREYKAMERRCKAQLLALRWRALHDQAGQQERAIREREVALEALIAEQRNADAAVERLRDAHHDSSEHFNQVQSRFYSVSGDIARVEQSIQHAQQRLRQLQDDLRDAEKASRETDSHLGQDRFLLAALMEELQTLLPEQEEMDALAETSAAALEEAERVMQGWQEDWERFNQDSAEPRQQVEIQQSRIQQLELSLERLAERQQRLRSDRQQLSSEEPQDADASDTAEQLATIEQELASIQSSRNEHAGQLQQIKEDLQQLSSRQQREQNVLQRLHGHIASLEALQQAALNPDRTVVDWLEKHRLKDSPRLIERLQVEPGWEYAVETVLGSDLNAVIVDSLADLPVTTLDQGALCILSADLPALAVAGSLLDKIQSPVDLSWLAHIKPVETLDEALAFRSSLAAGESLISRDGYWVGRNFLRIRREGDEQQGLLFRSQQLEQLQQQRVEQEQLLADLEIQSSISLERQRQHEQERDRLHADEQVLVRLQGELNAALSAARVRAEQLRLRCQRLDADLLELEEQQGMERETLAEARLALQSALELMTEDSDRREQMLSVRERMRERLEQARQAARQHKEQAHQLAVRLGALQAQHDSTHQALERLQQQSERLQERHEQLAFNLEEGQAPLEELRMRLEELLEQRLLVEGELKQARMSMEEIDRTLRETDMRRNQTEQQAQLIRSQLEQQRLDCQSVNTRCDTIRDQLREESHELNDLLSDLPDDAQASQWEEELDNLNSRIQRLGPINLAAIEEYQQQVERKEYLDAQNADLVEALETLENVIRKIDRETRNRFKETFDKINDGLQSLFPKVFGGGSACLELTGEDLLETGVTIMARPPGKKNSTIHLLSGGEKALTALALVFAIFQLNPSPFCMLDEVDAPLDDTNVGRYARLVREMSEKVQFIYITHNKIAMEMADQLMGVTMHEPGCSRLVAVDVEEALAMAET